MKKAEYIFTDSKGGYYTVKADFTDAGEQSAFRRAKVELAKFNGEITSPCRLWKIAGRAD